jgi:hypothetical protein
MKPCLKTVRIVILGTALFLLAGPVLRAADLSWTTEAVRFHGNILVVEGCFTNNTPEAIDRIRSFALSVSLRRHGEWREHSTATFGGLDVAIRPGDSLVHAFRIHKVEEKPFDAWNVSWSVVYHQQSHPKDEYRTNHQR